MPKDNPAYEFSIHVYFCSICKTKCIKKYEKEPKIRRYLQI